MALEVDRFERTPVEKFDGPVTNGPSNPHPGLPHPLGVVDRPSGWSADALSGWSPTTPPNGGGEHQGSGSPWREQTL